MAAASWVASVMTATPSYMYTTDRWTVDWVGWLGELVRRMIEVYGLTGDVYSRHYQ